MHYDQDLNLAQTVSDEAIARMKKDAIAPDPVSYEVWYAFYGNLHVELKKALDALARSKGHLTGADCRALHEQFLSDRRQQDIYQRASTQIQSTLHDFSGLMTNVREATSGYSDSLQGVSQKISKIKTPQEMATVLKDVVDDTNRMIENNRKLEQQIDLSSHVIEELKRDLEQVRREAMTDGLTGLANRKSFDEQVDALAADADHKGRIFTLLLLDIDHFKSFNDNFGHQVGDQVLRLVARTLTDGIKGKDVAARYGGEEFVIILPETNLDHGIAVGESLRRALANKEVINRSSGEMLGRITMSIGVAQYFPGETPHKLIERADAALYTAKHNGRNQVAAAPTPYERKQPASR